MRISHRITVGFLSFTILLVLVLFYEYNLIRRVVELTQRLSTVDFDLGQSTVRLENDLALVEEFTAKFFELSDPEPYATELADLLSEISGELERLVSLEVSAEENQLLRSVRDRWEFFAEGLRPCLEKAGSEAPREVVRDLDSQLSRIDQDVARLYPATRRQLTQTDAAAYRAGQNALHGALLAVVLAIIIGPLATFLIVRSIMEPIQSLTTATRRLASGDFGAHLQPPADEDMANLARDFNSMVRDLQELEQHKKEFFSAISHEIKAPLASMQETTSLLLEGLAGELSSKQQRMLQLNLRSGGRLMRLVNNILDYSRIEAGALTYDFRETDLREVIQESVQELQGLLHERQSRVESSFPPEPLEIRCDGERLLLVFRNLLDNALKYSPAGSLIRVEVDSADPDPSMLPEQIRRLPGSERRSWLLVRFRDQAPSIPKNERERIFRRFHQTPGRSMRTVGAGLGLAITRSVVQAHEGLVWVEPNPDEGNCFSVLLPRQGPAERAGRKERPYV